MKRQYIIKAIIDSHALKVQYITKTIIDSHALKGNATVESY